MNESTELELPKLVEDKDKEVFIKNLTHEELYYINLLLDDYLDYCQSFNDYQFPKNLIDGYLEKVDYPLIRETLEWFEEDLDSKDLIDYIVSTRDILFKTKSLDEYINDLEKKLENINLVEEEVEYEM